MRKGACRRKRPQGSNDEVLGIRGYVRIRESVTMAPRRTHDLICATMQKKYVFIVYEQIGTNYLSSLACGQK
jgi:hypothetical protein